MQPYDYDLVRAEVATFLREFRKTNGEPLVRSVRYREEVYEGPKVGMAADLILEPLRRSLPPRGDGLWADRVFRDYQTAWHSGPGFCICAGPRFASLSQNQACIQLNAPTMAAL